MSVYGCGTDHSLSDLDGLDSTMHDAIIAFINDDCRQDSIKALIDAMIAALTP